MNDDLEAIRRVLAADVESFRRLVERYRRPLLTLIRNLTPPDTDASACLIRGIDGGLVSVRRFGLQADGSLHEGQVEPQVGDPQFIAGAEDTLVDTPAADPRPVGAAQVTDDDPVAIQGQAAVSTGHPRRVEADITVRIPADEGQRARERDDERPVR